MTPGNVLYIYLTPNSTIGIETPNKTCYTEANDTFNCIMSRWNLHFTLLLSESDLIKISKHGWNPILLKCVMPAL